MEECLCGEDGLQSSLGHAGSGDEVAMVLVRNVPGTSSLCEY